MIVTMIMDMVEEITMEGSDNDQQKRDRPDLGGTVFYLFVFKLTALRVFSASIFPPSAFARAVFCLVMNVLTDFLYDITSAFVKVVMLP